MKTNTLKFIEEKRPSANRSSLRTNDLYFECTKGNIERSKNDRSSETQARRNWIWLLEWNEIMRWGTDVESRLNARTRLCASSSKIHCQLRYRKNMFCAHFLHQIMLTDRFPRTPPCWSIIWALVYRTVPVNFEIRIPARKFKWDLWAFCHHNFASPVNLREMWNNGRALFHSE